MDYQHILFDVEEAILTLTLNRPEKLNAFTQTMLRELVDALERADRDDAIRAIILTGAGRAYCAGADLSKGARTFDYAARENAFANAADRDGGGLLTLRMFNCRKPLIAAINGPAVGVGVTMTLAMDRRIASSEARFGFVFSRRGVVPEACSSWFLPRIVGISQALDWVYSGRLFEAGEALAGGLVSEVVEPGELMERAREIAISYSRQSSAVSVALARQMMWRMLAADHPMDAHRIDSQAMKYMGANADAREGIESFLQKREPRFSLSPSADMPDFFPWWEEPEFNETS